MKKRAAKKPPKVKKIKLTPDVVLLVEAPDDIIPAIVPHPEKNAVEIVPVPVTKSWSWWRMF